MNANLILSVIGAITASLPLVILPLKIRAGVSKYTTLYVFLFLFYISIVLYELINNSYITMAIYIFQMIFFLNMYRAYLQKELFMIVPMIVLVVNALAVLFTFYFITFNLFELMRDIAKKKKTSPLVLSSTALFEGGVIIQILDIVFNHTYISTWSLIFFIGATIMFIIPGLRVAYEKEEI